MVMTKIEKAFCDEYYGYKDLDKDGRPLATPANAKKCHEKSPHCPFCCNVMVMYFVTLFSCPVSERAEAVEKKDWTKYKRAFAWYCGCEEYMHWIDHLSLAYMSDIPITEQDLKDQLENPDEQV